MFLVTFRFDEDEEISVPARENENLMEVAKRGRVPLDISCMGNGTCGKCRVQILKGSLKSSKSFYINDVEYSEGWRLACTSRVIDDVILYIK
ncbi:MAG: 2Fe-2S iron-sulfur cluster binding domain-containing protein [Clostridia bacterium]|nr:2Fe-2S iron-sulfur cluster binding domain-containing protein [Clostridia bacterium]